MRSLLPVLTLPLLLAACGGGGGGTTPPPPICAQGVTVASQQASQTGTLTWTPSAVDWSRPHVPGKVLVASQPGGPALSTLGLLGQEVVPGLRVIAAPVGQEAALAARIRARGLQAQPDYLYQPLVTPSDPGMPGNGGVLIGGAAYVQTYLTQVKAPEAWTFLQGCGKQPEAARTFVLDSLVNGAHPDLNERVQVGASYLTDEDGGSDSSGHGTATAGLIAAETNNAQGVAGVTWQGTVTTLEVIGQLGASTASIASALNDAVGAGAKVVNMSLGSPVSGAGDPDPVLSAALTDAAKSAVLVVAAGNEADKGLFYPASHPSVIAVGAAGANDDLTCYSARPSSGQLSAKGHFMLAPGGSGSCVGATNATQMLTLSQGGAYTLQAGTSFAAPLVSGAAALMRAANPALSAAQTKSLLLSSARVTGAGWKFLDVNAAVQAATR